MTEGKKREQERETMDKTTLCNCTPNLHKLVHQVPLCGGVLAIVNIITEVTAVINQSLATTIHYLLSLFLSHYIILHCCHEVQQELPVWGCDLVSLNYHLQLATSEYLLGYLTESLVKIEINTPSFAKGWDLVLISPTL